VEEDLVGLMVRLDVAAASIALSGVSDARDKKAMWWSTINHLEAAEAKLRSRMESAVAFESAQTYLYVSAIKALIFRYLDEERLVARCLDDSRAIVLQQQRFAGSAKEQIKGVVSLFYPRTWISAFRPSSLERAARDFRPATFWEAMGFPGSHELRLKIVAAGARGSGTTISYWPRED
jgi:hypothetical protein